jgi:hypothetical protein
VGEQGDELDGGFGQAVDRSLLMAWIVAAGDQATLFKAPQPIRKNNRRDPFGGSRQQLPEVTATSKHQVTDDDQAPSVGQHLQRQNYGAPGPMNLAFRDSRSKCVDSRHRLH